MTFCLAPSPAVLLGTRILTCLSLSAGVLLSKSMAGLALGSGLSRIFSQMKASMAMMLSDVPLIKQTLSVVPDRVSKGEKEAL